MSLHSTLDAIITIPSLTGVVMSRLIDRTGDRYERLTVVERLTAKTTTSGSARWFCRCDCGRGVVAYGQDLDRGKVKSCGCLNADRIMQHGMSHLPVYAVWQAMLQRCENPKAQSYANYGGRGISVCERWHRFENFIADMGHPSPGKSLDRRDVNGNYEKDNCRWATSARQANNKRNNRVVEFNGEQRTLSEWAKVVGIDWFALRTRLDSLGWSVEKALTTPSTTARRYEFNGKSQTLPQWAAEYGHSYDLVKARLNKLGWTLEQALTLPAGPKNSHAKAH